ncbi:hypothetical protein HMPREF1705_04661 [Acetomicrobium hydrogeniformans ATCC BAA-1850]|uniref:Uncharacterized protein n=1 Tax=Acetomicrobium hydrogeniformans ATCC BAA-1850 TaxID=592015 RepID=A0A0T5XAM6_9BACT|nr:hypothetical protein HMPREF1705_04661 [Acetomicrobium hydrogeniformans ATCC BAA-1850]
MHKVFAIISGFYGYPGSSIMKRYQYPDKFSYQIECSLLSDV